MQSFIAILSLVALALAPVAQGRAKGTGGRQNRNCTPWQFAECVPSSGTCGRGVKQGTRSGDSCPVTEREAKCRVPCNSGCKYSKQGATWSACDTATNTKTMTLTLTEPRDGCEATKTKTKPCGRRSRTERDVEALLDGQMQGDQARGSRQKGCRYNKSEWSACDVATDTITRTLTLKRARPSMEGQCEATVTQTKKCKKACKYDKGEWAACDESSNTRTKTRTLRKGDTDRCETTITKTKRCGKNKEGQGRSSADRKQRRRNRKNGEALTDCKYTRGEWTECQGGQRTNVKALESGASTCEPTKTVSRPCGGAAGGRSPRKKGRGNRGRGQQAAGDADTE